MSTTYLGTRSTITVCILLISVFLLGLPARADFSVAGGPVIYRTPGYNYAPSVFQNGNVQYFWWCGYNQSLNADSIWYASMDLNTQTFITSPTIVLVPSYGTWDGAEVCDPTVVQGSFNIPGIGSATYAMYYTGASSSGSTPQNAVGVAFSNNGYNWVRYGNPVITPAQWPTAQGNYGAGQPSAYNSNGGSNIQVIYSDTTNGSNIFLQTSMDGITFSGASQILGLPPSGVPNADFGYDYSTNTWYAAVPTGPNRSGYPERWSMSLFQTSNLLSGSCQQLGTIDTNLTGSLMNHSPGLLKDIYGNVTPFLPNIQVFYAQAGTDGYPYNSWQLTFAVWNPYPSLLAFNRYYSSYYGDHWVTTGYYNSSYYYLEENLGYLYMAPPNGYDTYAVYGCQIGGDHFVSPDPNCEGQQILGLNGYIFASSQNGGIPNQALYECYTGTDHFVSTDPACEGYTGYLIGYASLWN